MLSGVLRVPLFGLGRSHRRAGSEEAQETALGWRKLSVCPCIGKGFWITFVLPDLDHNVDFRMRDLCKIWSWMEDVTAKDNAFAHPVL